VTAVGLALISAVLFGGMSVGLRLGLNRRPDAALATLATVGGAFAVALVFMLAESPSRGWHAGAAWPFFLAGILQPGIGQLLVTMAIREAGASRASVVFGSAPLVSVAIALVLLGEPLRWALVVVAITLGPRVRRWDGIAPFLGVGLLFGLSYVSLFEAYYRGRVTVVSPLVATESLWGVVLSVLLLRHTELVGRRLALGALLVVVGGALIGAYR
jgi:drug/metabolite transporter (DMT)-like permease